MCKRSVGRPDRKAAQLFENYLHRCFHVQRICACNMRRRDFAPALPYSTATANPVPGQTAMETTVMEGSAKRVWAVVLSCAESARLSAHTLSGGPTFPTMLPHTATDSAHARAIMTATNPRTIPRAGSDLSDLRPSHPSFRVRIMLRTHGSDVRPEATLCHSHLPSIDVTTRCASWLHTRSKGSTVCAYHQGRW